MDENKNYEVEVIDTDNDEFEIEEGKEIGTGVAMLIGAALTGAAIGAVKVGKKAWNKIKAKRDIAKARHETIPEDVAKDEDFAD